VAVRPGLRERKKAKTRAAIQEHALRLFRERGYDATTIEQIADAAEISPSTFFRYFPTKEDLVLYDALDPFFLGALARQPAHLSPIRALRAAFREALTEASPDEMARQLERAQLMVEVPDLRMRALDQIVTSLDLFAEAVAARVGRPADDLRVQALVGAVAGVGIVAWLGGAASRSSDADYLARLDTALDLLEAGLPT
jgi:AcrR family transcriptional regulator